jgi:hypothetical protein
MIEYTLHYLGAGTKSQDRGDSTGVSKTQFDSDPGILYNESINAIIVKDRGVKS